MAIIYATEDTFQGLIDTPNATVLVDFYAEWCGPCKSLGPILEECAQTLREDQLIVKVNIDECGKVTKSFRVMSVPTMIVFKEGKEFSRTVGLRDKKEIQDLIA